MRYLVVIERSEGGFSAYSPDLPGCIATSESEQGVAVAMREAIAFHLEGLRSEGLPVPEPSSSSIFVEVAA